MLQRWQGEAWSSACRSRMTGGLRSHRRGRQTIEAAMGAAGNQWPVDQAGADGGEMAQLTALLKRLVAAPERGGQPSE